MTEMDRVVHALLSGDLTVVQLADRLSRTPESLRSSLRRLIRDGVVVEARAKVATRRGRPPKLWSLRNRMEKIDSRLKKYLVACALTQEQDIIMKTLLAGAQSTNALAHQLKKNPQALKEVLAGLERRKLVEVVSSVKIGRELVSTWGITRYLVEQAGVPLDAWSAR